MSRLEFSVYDPETGKIVSASVVYDEGDLLANVPDNMDYIEGWYNPSEFYVSDGEPVAYPPKPFQWMTFDYVTHEWIDARGEADLEVLRASAMIKLNNVIQNQRRMLITDLPGQDMIYLRKEQEGRAYLAASPEPTDLSSYPLLTAEVGITAPTAHQVAMIWVQLADMWVIAAAQIEAYRLTIGAQIQAASTFEALTALMDSLN